MPCQLYDNKSSVYLLTYFSLGKEKSKAEGKKGTERGERGKIESKEEREWKRVKKRTEKRGGKKRRVKENR